MIHLHLLDWAFGALALFGVILGLRNTSWILFWLPSRRRTKSMAMACCVCLGLLGLFLAVSDITRDHQPETTLEAAKPKQMTTESAVDDASIQAENADKITPEPTSSQENTTVSAGERVSKPAQVAPETLIDKPSESAPSLTQERERAQQAIITRNRCRTASGHLMAQSQELPMQAESLRRAGNQATLQDMESHGTARRLP